MNEHNSVDLLGIKPIANAVQTVSEESIKGVKAFLSKICSPCAEEFGLLLQDNVKVWRLNNAIRVMQKSKGLLEFKDNNLQLKAHPRVVMGIIEQSSWQDDDELQNLWAGLLVSSCSDSGTDDNNLKYLSILNKLSKRQALIINYACKNAPKRLQTKYNLLSAIEDFEITKEKLLSITNTIDMLEIDADLDYLRSLELIVDGICCHTSVINLTPTPLALYLYVKCQGYSGTATEYFGLNENQIIIDN